MGVGSGMLELLFDNSHAFFRSKKIHVRLGVADEQTYIVSLSILLFWRFH